MELRPDMELAGFKNEVKAMPLATAESPQSFINAKCFATVESPPQVAPGAPPSGTQTPAGTAPLAAGGEGRIPQRTSPKTATVEETKATFLVRQETQQQQRKVLRAAVLESLREGSEAGEADGRVD